MLKSYFNKAVYKSECPNDQYTNENLYNLVIRRETQLETAIRDHHTAIDMVKMKRTDDIKCTSEVVELLKHSQTAVK